MTWLRVDDGFPEHEKVLGLKGAGAKWLHVVALCQCAKNLTDGYIDPQRLKVVCAVADVPRPAHCIKQLVDVGLWEPDGDGFRIRDYLDYNPDAATVKAKREAKRAAGRIGGFKSGEARRGQANGEAPAEASASFLLPRLVQHPDPDPDRPYRPVEVLSPGKAENPAVVGAAERLFAAIRPEHRDRGTRAIVLAFVQELEPADFESVTGELERCRDDIRCEGKWVNGALRKRAVKRAATRRQVA